MTFDPFGDFATEGYLRNFEKEKDLAIIKRAENTSFTTGLDETFAMLAKSKVLTYDEVLRTHGILFGAVYPWAGQDRTQTAPNLTIRKGSVIFANAPEIRAAVEFALQRGQDAGYMSAKPGEIMGYLAYGHPFLDGNGRAIMTVHSVLAQRAGFSIDWSATRKDAYLDALTKEIENPPKGHLDADLRPFMRDPIAYEQLPTAIVQAPGLDGGAQDAALTRFSATSTSHVSGLNTRQCWRSAKEFEIDRFHPRSAPWMEFFDTIEYAGGIEMAPNNFVHAIRKLPVRFTPQRSA